ncbi:MAG TPA: hypothetical protein VN132_06300, partial [Bdellovibrio sp.]|nr:hypothetical protein [Bdellovibrio sp.]
MELIIRFFKLLNRSKGKIVLMLLSAVIFIFALFPFDDLSDLISSQVSQLSGNSLYVQFERLKMS